MKIKHHKFFLFVFFIASFALGQGTDEQLAFYYHQNDECEKAIGYFNKIYPDNSSDKVFKAYTSCLQEMDDKKTLERIYEQQIKIHPKHYEYSTILIKYHENEGNEKAANKITNDLIKNLTTNSRDIINLQQAFTSIGKYDKALEVLEFGRKQLKNYPFNIQFAEVYGAMGNEEKMIEEYIDLLDYNAGMIYSLQRIIPRMIDFEDQNSKGYQILKNNLIKKIQKDPNNEVYSSFLIWVFVQSKNFDAALTQAKALDKRSKKNGKEVFDIANISKANKSYPTARKAYQYILDLGSSSPYYYSAEEQLLNTRFTEITTNKNYSNSEINDAIQEYHSAIARINNPLKSFKINLELAKILAFYNSQPEEAKTILETLLENNNSTDMMKAEAKILLADIFVILNDIWEASLLYMQVENDFKYEPIGHEAKYKNAKVFYFNGEYKWAQSQLDILKESTTKLIANDAMKLSIFITENLGLDSNYRVMNLFSHAELLIAQRKFNEANEVLDSIQATFPFHKLTDDIYMKKASIQEEKGNWEQAITYYTYVYENFPDDLLADEAIFKKAMILENQKNDIEQAKTLYFKILKNYPGSLLVTKARERYRAL